MSPERDATKLTREYVKKFPKTSKLGLSKKMVKEHPLLFKSVEYARTCIRTVTGNMGVRVRKEKKDKSLFEHHGFIEGSPAEVGDPFVFPQNVSKTLIINDVHYPYHNLESLLVALEYGYKAGIDSILLNGDIADCYAMSRFQKNPEKRDFQFEIDAMRGFIKSLRAMFPDAHIYYYEGNHEMRWKKFLIEKSAEVFDIEEFQFESMIRLAEHKVHWIDDQVGMKYGKMNIRHGHEFIRGMGAGVYAARNTYAKFSDSVCFGHIHRSDSFMQTSYTIPFKDRKKVYSIGCLCQLRQNYAPDNLWNHGFATIEKDSSGDFEFTNMRIDGKKITVV